MKVCGQAADEVLRRKKVNFEVRVQAEESKRCRDSAVGRGVPLHRIIKSMVFGCHPRGEPGDVTHYLHCMVPGHCQVRTRRGTFKVTGGMEGDEEETANLAARKVSQSKLQAHAGCECYLLDPEKMRCITGAEVGAVHPFVPGVSRRILDERVLQNEEVSFNSGDMRIGLIVKTEHFLEAFEGEVAIADIAYCEEDEYSPVAKKFGISLPDAKYVVDRPEVHDFFSRCVEDMKGQDRNTATSSQILEWVRTLVRFASQNNSSINVVNTNWLKELITSDNVTKYAKEQALRTYVLDRKPPPLPQVQQDSWDEISHRVQQSLAKHSAVVDKVRQCGQKSAREKEKITNFLMGEIMRDTGGRLAPKEVRKAIVDSLQALHSVS